MHLKGFSSLSPNILSSGLFKAIETAIPASEIEKAIVNSKANEKRNRSLPTQLVVYLLIAMSFWSKHSMGDVLKNLIDGMSEKWLKHCLISLSLNN